MLKGIDPLLSGDLLRVLDDMGHGDLLLLVDRNYPAAASGKPVIRLGEVTVLRAATAILSVLPLDTFVEHPIERMEVDDDPTLTTMVQDALLALPYAVEILGQTRVDPRGAQRVVDEVDDDLSLTTMVQVALLALAARAEGRQLEYGVVPRLDFYDRASRAYAVVHTLDPLPYGCFILHKGVIFDS